MSKQRNENGDRHGQVPDEPADATAAAAALEASESEIAKLRADLEDASDRVLRAQAELENYRKRAQREIADERRYALAPFLKDLLPVLDNVFRAIAHAEKSPQNDGLLEGVKLVAQSLLSVLARHHCKPIDALHKPFDPAFHEAISQQPTDEFPPNTVVLVAQEGYMLHDRVLRAAQVIVSRAPD
jgi:molecular chaperone GrpE